MYSLNWAPQLCILIGCGILQQTLSVARRSFLDEGRKRHLSVGVMAIGRESTTISLLLWSKAHVQLLYRPIHPTSHNIPVQRGCPLRRCTAAQAHVSSFAGISFQSLSPSHCNQSCSEDRGQRCPLEQWIVTVMKTGKMILFSFVKLMNVYSATMIYLRILKRKFLSIFKIFVCHSSL